MIPLGDHSSIDTNDTNIDGKYKVVFGCVAESKDIPDLEHSSSSSDRRSTVPHR